MEKTMDSTAAKIRGIASIVVAIIIAIAVIVSAVILAGGDYGRDQIQCTTVASGNGGDKAMERDMVMNVMLTQGDTEIGTQKARYDYDANTILIETAEINGSSQANIAIDYDRSVVFIEILGESECLGSDLHGDMLDMADRVTAFMREQKQQAIDIATARTQTMNYVRIGTIPAGYVTVSNGPIIRSLCAGAVSNWTELQTGGSGRKRRAFSISAVITVCVFFCFDISIA